MWWAALDLGRARRGASTCAASSRRPSPHPAHAHPALLPLHISLDCDALVDLHRHGYEIADHTVNHKRVGGRVEGKVGGRDVGLCVQQPLAATARLAAARPSPPSTAQIHAPATTLRWSSCLASDARLSRARSWTRGASWRRAASLRGPLLGSGLPFWRSPRCCAACCPTRGSSTTGGGRAGVARRLESCWRVCDARQGGQQRRGGKAAESYEAGARCGRLHAPC